MELGELYPAHFDALAGYAARLTGSRAAGEDAAQETFMRAMEHADTLLRLTDGQQKSWLYTTLRRIVIDQKRRVDRAPPIEHEPVHVDDLTRLEVLELLEKLGEDNAQIVRLKLFGGLNSTQIGALMSVPPATVRTRLRSAMKKLRKILEE